MRSGAVKQEGKRDKKTGNVFSPAVAPYIFTLQQHDRYDCVNKRFEMRKTRVTFSERQAEDHASAMCYTSCDQRSMMRSGQPPNPLIPCRCAKTEKPFPPLSDNDQKIRHHTEIFVIFDRNLVFKYRKKCMETGISHLLYRHHTRSGERRWNSPFCAAHTVVLFSP